MKSQMQINRRAKIVATLGPSSNSKEVIEKLVNSGLNIARLNFSHGTHESHFKIIIYHNYRDLTSPLSTFTQLV